VNLYLGVCSSIGRGHDYAVTYQKMGFCRNPRN